MRSLLTRPRWMRGWRTPALLALVALAALGVVFSPLIPSANVARAGSAPPPIRARHGGKLLLPGSVPAALASATAGRPLDGATLLHVTISLGLSDPNGLAALIASQQNPKSPQHHKYITPQVFADRFAPSAQSVSAVRGFLTAAGLRVTSVSSNRTQVQAAGTATQLEKAFGVTIERYQLGQTQVYGPDRAPVIPDTLASIIVNVAGLDDVAQAQLATVAGDKAAIGTGNTSPRAANASASTRTVALKTPAVPAAGPVAGTYSPTNLRNAYDITTLINAGGDGTGQRIGVYEAAPYIPGDVASYRTQYGLGTATINDTAIDGGVPTCSAGGQPCDVFGVSEGDLDLEMLSAIAPNATLDVYTQGFNPSSGAFWDAYNQMVVDDNDAVIVTGWQENCDQLLASSALHAMDTIFAQAAAQGQTIAAAAGDWGSDGCISAGAHAPSVDAPASDPYVLAVGGTTLTLTGGVYGSEVVWNHNPSTNPNNPSASGGGLSAYFDQPSWQLGGGVVNAYSTGEREVPDVAAVADSSPGVSGYCTSVKDCNGVGWTSFYTTSVAAGIWAGALTDANTYLLASAVPALGWVNQTLYQLFSNSQSYNAFHDITSGNNNADYGAGSPYQGDYPASACYDLATGIGSPDVWNITRDVQGGVQTSGGGPCQNTAPVTTNLVQDGGFEQPSGSSPWTQFSIQGYPVIFSSGAAHTGNAAFFPCGYAACDDRVSQPITVPATVHHATLRFWLQSFSSLPLFSPNPPCVDHLYATLATPDGTVLSGGGAAFSTCVSATLFHYQFESIDVTSLLQNHTSQQLSLMFRGTAANETALPQAYTAWAVDDVALLVW